jgi:hypothetical protein
VNKTIEAFKVVKRFFETPCGTEPEEESIAGEIEHTFQLSTKLNSVA